MEKKSKEAVNHPSHYQDPSGVECITIVRHRNFDIGNAIKYLWRAGLKSEEGKSDIDKQIEDLRKAIWYIEDEIKTLQESREKSRKQRKGSRGRDITTECRRCRSSS